MQPVMFDVWCGVVWIMDDKVEADQIWHLWVDLIAGWILLIYVLICCVWLYFKFLLIVFANLGVTMLFADRNLAAIQHSFSVIMVEAPDYRWGSLFEWKCF